MQSASSAPVDPTARIQRFLQRVDRFSDHLGLSVPPIADLEFLRQLPPGTLGRTWADALDQQNLQPFTTGPRRKQLHDGVHVLTGYGTDAIAEAEVQAFLLGAKFHPVHIALGLGLLRLIQRQREPGTDPAALRQQVRQRLRRAYQWGRQSHFDPDTWRPEDLWDRPLAEVRQLFGLENQ